MWMTGYNDGGEFSSIQDSFNGRKLRPLMPRPAPAACVNPQGLSRVCAGHDLLALNRHLATGTQNKLSGAQQVVVSSRWNPTPEQLQTLEELYRRGTRTPSAEQIQHITAQLRRYGKIEGKNVFYWFQNHKARERQKRRRQLQSPHNEQQPHHADKKESSAGANRRAYEVEQTKNWVSPTNSRTIAEKSVSTQGAVASAKVAEAESKGADGWLQFEEGPESQQRRNAAWQMARLSYSPSPSTLTINSFSAAIAHTSIQSTATGTLLEIKKTHDFLDINREALRHSSAGDSSTSNKAQTLQLFPLENYKEEEDIAGVEAMNAANGNDVTTYQFFEFLPLKN